MTHKSHIMFFDLNSDKFNSSDTIEKLEMLNGAAFSLGQNSSFYTLYNWAVDVQSCSKLSPFVNNEIRVLSTNVGTFVIVFGVHLWHYSLTRV